MLFFFFPGGFPVTHKVTEGQILFLFLFFCIDFLVLILNTLPLSGVCLPPFVYLSVWHSPPSVTQPFSKEPIRKKETDEEGVFSRSRRRRRGHLSQSIAQQLSRWRYFVAGTNTTTAGTTTPSSQDSGGNGLWVDESLRSFLCLVCVH